MPSDQSTADRPLAPTCAACREPAGTCFPNACKAHLAHTAFEKADREEREEMDYQQYLSTVSA